MAHRQDNAEIVTAQPEPAEVKFPTPTRTGQESNSGGGGGSSGSEEPEADRPPQVADQRKEDGTVTEEPEPEVMQVVLPPRTEEEAKECVQPLEGETGDQCSCGGDDKKGIHPVPSSPGQLDDEDGGDERKAERTPSVEEHNPTPQGETEDQLG